MTAILEGLGMILLGVLAILGVGVTSELLRGLSLKVVGKQSAGSRLTARCLVGATARIVFGLARSLTPVFV